MFSLVLKLLPLLVLPLRLAKGSKDSPFGQLGKAQLRPDDERDFGIDIGNELTASSEKPMEIRGVDSEDEDEEVVGEVNGDVNVDREVVVVAGDGNGVLSKCIS